MKFATLPFILSLALEVLAKREQDANAYMPARVHAVDYNQGAGNTYAGARGGAQEQPPRVSYPQFNGAPGAYNNSSSAATPTPKFQAPTGYSRSSTSTSSTSIYSSRTTRTRPPVIPRPTTSSTALPQTPVPAYGEPNYGAPMYRAPAPTPTPTFPSYGAGAPLVARGAGANSTTVVYGVAPIGTRVAPIGTGVAPIGTGVAPIGTGVAPIGTGVAPIGTGVAPIGTGVAPIGTGVPYVIVPPSPHTSMEPSSVQSYQGAAASIRVGGASFALMVATLIFVTLG